MTKQTRIPLSPELAMEIFLDTWTWHLALDIAHKLTCVEAEAIADLFAAHDNDELATQWIEHHSFSDDCGDLHCRCPQCATHDEAEDRTHD